MRERWNGTNLATWNHRFREGHRKNQSIYIVSWFSIVGIADSQPITVLDDVRKPHSPPTAAPIHCWQPCWAVQAVWSWLILSGWVMPNSVDTMLESWGGERGIRRYVKVWGAVPACFMWFIWRKWNWRTFEGRELSFPNLRFLFLRTLFEWAS